MELSESISKQTDVSMTLTGSVLSLTEVKNKNLVLSPLSIHVLLSLITAGSSGSTRDQHLWFLKSDSSDDLNKLCSEIVPLVFADGSAAGGPKLSYANGIWVDQTLPLKSFSNKLLIIFIKPILIKLILSTMGLEWSLM